MNLFLTLFGCPDIKPEHDENGMEIKTQEICYVNKEGVQVCEKPKDEYVAPKQREWNPKL